VSIEQSAVFLRGKGYLGLLNRLGLPLNQSVEFGCVFPHDAAGYAKSGDQFRH
jgi:hypothetical protein